MYKQIIIARKDLNMSPGKLAAQVSHGSMAFLTSMIQKSTVKVGIHESCPTYTSSGDPQLYRRGDLNQWAEEARNKGKSSFCIKPVNPFKPNGELKLCEQEYIYKSTLRLPVDLYEQWIDGEFTKCVLAAKNKTQLLKAKAMAEELGMIEGKDFFLIRDNCHTELEPEEDGKTLTVIGFRPIEAEVIDQIGKKFQLY